MHSAEDIEIQLWEYIDGVCDEAARERIANLIATNATWQQKHTELITFNTNLKHMEPEYTSMRFSKNVMESITGISVARPANSYVNRWVIRGIAAVFALLVGGTIVYLLNNIKWTNTTSGVSFDYGRIFNSNFITYVILANLLIGIVFLDTLLRKKKKTVN